MRYFCTNSTDNALDADNVNKLECLADAYSDTIDSKTEILQESLIQRHVQRNNEQ